MGLRLEVAKRIVAAMRRVVLDHSATVQCFAGLRLEPAKRTVTAVRREEVGCRGYKRASWEAAQSTGSPQKWLLREEVSERRCASAKRFLEKK